MERIQVIEMKRKLEEELAKIKVPCSVCERPSKLKCMDCDGCETCCVCETK